MNRASDRASSPQSTSVSVRFHVPPLAAFRPEYLDFARGIRIGRLEPEHRLTRLVKEALESAFQRPFVTVRWGRGLYWQWIGFFPREALHAISRSRGDPKQRRRSPRAVRPSFGCAKYFVALDREERTLQAGMQVERGYLIPPPELSPCRLGPDWDWHRLFCLLARGSPWERLLERLLHQDGFRIFVGSWESGRQITAANFSGAHSLRRLMARAPARHWCGFQLFYSLSEEEVRTMSGHDILDSILAIFAEVTPLLNACWATPLL